MTYSPHWDSSRGAALRVDDLRVAVRSMDGEFHAVVRDVSFSMEAGETLAVIGESGCGKTTLALAIARLLPDSMTVQHGRVEVDGHSILDAGGAELLRLRVQTMGVVFQDSIGTLNPLRTVGSVLTEVAKRGFRSKSEALARARECVDAVGLPERVLTMYPHELSGGMRQRVAIGIAIANEPRLLIADEPTTALDATVQAQVLDLLSALKTAMSLMIITHDISVASQIADRIMVMYAGTVVEVGDGGRVLKQPAHPYTKALIAARPQVGQSLGVPLMTIPGIPPNLRADPPVGCVFRDRCQRRGPRCIESPCLEGGGAQQVACWYPVEGCVPVGLGLGGG